VKVLDESCYFPCGFLECRGVAGIGALLLRVNLGMIRTCVLDGWMRVSRASARKSESWLDWTGDKLKGFQAAQILGARGTGIGSIYA
jgi:hypothetical protein